MKPIRSFAPAVALASLISTASLTAHAADVPLGSTALERKITQLLAVDAANYQVTVEGPDKSQVPSSHRPGQGPAQPKVGDKVDIYVIRSVAYTLDTDVNSDRGVSTKSAITRADKDNPNPGGEAFRQVKVTSKITHIDLKKHEVTLLPPEGKVKVVKVEDPELQARMKNLKVGQHGRRHLHRSAGNQNLTLATCAYERRHRRRQSAQYRACTLGWRSVLPCRPGPVIPGPGQTQAVGDDSI